MRRVWAAALTALSVAGAFCALAWTRTPAPGAPAAPGATASTAPVPGAPATHATTRTS